MDWIPEMFEEINKGVREGKSPTTTIRTMLSWFGAYRRSWRNVAEIRAALEQLNLETIPDFESGHINGLIKI